MFWNHLEFIRIFPCFCKAKQLKCVTGKLVQLAVGPPSLALQLQGNALIGRLDCARQPPTGYCLSFLEGPLTPILFYPGDRGATDRTVMVTVVVIDWCIGHQGEEKKLNKQEERNSGGIWGRGVKKRWREKKNNKRAVRTQRKTFLKPKTASCVTPRSKAWVWTELILGQRSDGSYGLFVYIL